MSMNAHAPAQTSPLRVQVAEEVRAAMARRRLSGSALARRLGKSHTWVSSRILGKVALDLDDLEAIAAVLDIPVTTLLGTGAVTSRYRTGNDSRSVTEITPRTSQGIPGKLAPVIPLRPRTSPVPGDTYSRSA